MNVKGYFLAVDFVSYLNKYFLGVKFLRIFLRHGLVGISFEVPLFNKKIRFLELKEYCLSYV